MQRTAIIVSALALAAALAQTAAGQDLPPPEGATPPGFGILPQPADAAPEVGAPAEAEPAAPGSAEDAEPVEEEAPDDAEPVEEEATDDAATEEEGPQDDAAQDDAAQDEAPDAGAAGDEEAPVLEIVRETHGDWQIRCTPDEEDCFLYQLALDSEGHPVAEFSLVRLPAGGEAAAGATVVTPLGTLLPAGLYMRIDGGELRQYPFTFCSQVGCFAQLALTQATVTSLQRGRSAQLVVASVAAPDDPVELDVSLTGFTAAYNALQPGD
jgi:invasion protein IalB